MKFLVLIASVFVANTGWADQTTYFNCEGKTPEGDTQRAEFCAVTLDDGSRLFAGCEYGDPGYIKLTRILDVSGMIDGSPTVETVEIPGANADFTWEEDFVSMKLGNVVNMSIVADEAASDSTYELEVNYKAMTGALSEVSCYQNER